MLWLQSRFSESGEHIYGVKFRITQCISYRGTDVTEGRVDTSWWKIPTPPHADFAQYLEHYKNRSCPTTDCTEWRLRQGDVRRLLCLGQRVGIDVLLTTPIPAPKVQAPLRSPLCSSFLAASLATTPTQGASNTRFPWHFLASTNKNGVG